MSSLGDFPFLEQHPPERGGSGKRPIVLYSCCCCCCCCLHTIGGAIGTAIGGMLPKEVELTKSPDYQVPSGQGLYWSSFLITTFIGTIVTWVKMLTDSSSYSAYGPDTSPLQLLGNAAGIVGITIILLGPLWFLGAGVVMAIRTTFYREEPMRNGYWRQLGYMMGGMLIGTLGGILVMALIFGVMSSL